MVFPSSRLKLSVVAAASLLLLVFISTRYFPQKGYRIVFHDGIFQSDNAIAVDASPSNAISFSKKLGVVLVTTVTNEEMHLLRELVGSIHSFRQHNFDVPHLIVYGFGVSEKEKKEIGLWRNVDYFDAASELLLGAYRVAKLPPTSLSVDDVKSLRLSTHAILSALDITLRKFGSALYVRCDLHFDRDTLVALSQHVALNGYFLGRESSDSELSSVAFFFPAMGFRLDSAATRDLILHPLQCLRGYQCSNTRAPTYDTHLLSRFYLTPSTSSKYELQSFCHVLLRDDVLYTHIIASSDQHTDPPHPTASRFPYNKTRVALGIPTVSTAGMSPVDLPILTTFLPSLVTSITLEERNKYSFVLYIGFDEGDILWDDHVSFSETERAIWSSVGGVENGWMEFVFVRVPFSKGWVTFIWNALFTLSINSGASYFYQVNDDLRFVTAGWTTKLIHALERTDGFGVAGPKDPRHQRKLLTQAMVGRKHYDLFGRLYPVDIKDWFSDDWLSEVYGSQYTHLVTDVTVRTFCPALRSSTNETRDFPALARNQVENTNTQGTRYDICRKPRYEQALKDGKEVVRKWLVQGEGAGVSRRSLIGI
ncbi:hypothetical protein M427DRAFT_160377 [Gonapodya prolifera JEL478]|uniref:Uncharacterized protein n=1 Tax=Gonapodya prolifera (strain JEL478) TaxID=1344416 RepID=A0A138ZZW6_GONPJ|nr:hypothetical protein M427DRAFT_160377 [Gonapodya prolifera JEL478]|eukprot:KXS09683.1 hypothetical protein M427DRAFT_160377 [Gonapodya prolifera JEL478]